VDQTLGLSYGMDLTPLMTDASISPAEFVQGLIQRFAQDVHVRVNRMVEKS
jgi:hypothetical protein